MEENLADPKAYSPKESEAEKVKKIAENIKSLGKKDGGPTAPTPREMFLKRINAEKDPVKRKILLQVLRGRMFE